MTVHVNLGWLSDASRPVAVVMLDVEVPARHDASRRGIRDRGAELAYDLIRRLIRMAMAELRKLVSDQERLGVVIM